MHDLRIQLRDLNPALVFEWEEAFTGIQSVTAEEADYLSGPADAVVSPANSFGVMDGGLDLLLSNTLPGIQDRVQAVISAEYHDEMPVGSAEVIRTGHERWPFLLCAPTMRVIENVDRTINAYLAFRAILWAVGRFNAGAESQGIHSVLVPGLATGVGRMDERRCAKQMRLAWDSMQGYGEIPGLQAIQAGHVRLLSV